MCYRFTQANGKLRAEEPETKGGVSKENSRVSHSLLHPDWLPDGYNNREPIQAHLRLRRTHGGLLALQKGL